MKIKKLFLITLMILLSTLMFTACGKNGGGKSSKAQENSSSAEGIKNFTIESYKLQYKGHEIVKDDDGNNALVLDCKFYNNSEESACCFWSIYDTAMQNGEELNWAYVSADSDRNLITDGCNTMVQPGNSVECKIAYVLIDTTSPVTVTFADSVGRSPQTLTVNLK